MPKSPPRRFHRIAVSFHRSVFIFFHGRQGVELGQWVMYGVPSPIRTGPRWELRRLDLRWLRQRMSAAVYGQEPLTLVRRSNRLLAKAKKVSRR